MRFLAALLLALMIATPAAAALDAKAEADVAAIEAYLNGINTLKARFIQTTGDGKQVAGTFMLRRPGRMRFEYAPPSKDFIVADGMFIHYYDSSMKQGSRTLISKSLADFFLRKQLTLSGDLKVSEVTRDGTYIMVKMVEAQDPNAGSLTLALTEKPLALKKWRIVDPQGAITEVELFDIATGIQLDRDQFRYYDPEHGKGYN
jgi:outer membrane lipoprotein-sorting protein